MKSQIHSRNETYNHSQKKLHIGSDREKLNVTTLLAEIHYYKALGSNLNLFVWVFYGRYCQYSLHNAAFHGTHVADIDVIIV